jgi:SAM-dependent methyltransferase
MAVPASALASPQRETVSCRACSASPCTPYLSARGYAVVRCDSCGLLYVNPQPSLGELEEYYAAYDLGEQWVSGEEPFNRGVRRTILRFKKGGSALDVGCGPGNFLRCLREAGFHVFGVEPSEPGSSYAKSVHHIETFHGTVDAFLATGTKAEFDLVTLLNVLEHLKDPSAVLLQLRQLLRNDGILVVGVPDARLHTALGEARRRLGFKDPFWMDTVRHPLVGIDPPHHLTSFEPRTISQLLARCGFELVYLRNAPVMFNADRWKNVAKTMLHAFSETLYWLTLGQLVLGYSTLVVVTKRDRH